MHDFFTKGGTNYEKRMMSQSSDGYLEGEQEVPMSWKFPNQHCGKNNIDGRAGENQEQQ